jgi:transcription elongation factor Elf1
LKAFLLESFSVELEHFFDCPFCGERISAVLDLTGGGQSYIEDCEVCCRPMLIRYECGMSSQLESFTAEGA